MIEITRVKGVASQLGLEEDSLYSGKKWPLWSKLDENGAKSHLLQQIYLKVMMTGWRMTGRTGTFVKRLGAGIACKKKGVSEA